MTDQEKSIKEEGQFTFEREGIQGLCEALGDEDRHLRRMAAIFLGSTVDERAIKHLCAALHDEEKEIRAEAMEGLVRLGGQSVPALIPFLEDGDWVVRYRAAEALGRIGDTNAVEPLIAALGDEKDHVRYIAAKGLGLMGVEAALSSLILLLDDENPYVRSCTASAIAAIGGEQGCTALQEALERETVKKVASALRSALEVLCRDTS